MVIKKRRLHTTYAGKKRKYTKKNKSTLSKLVVYILIFFVFFSGLFTMILYFKYIKNLPSPSELEDLDIAESSVIYDKNGDELYKIFKEKRTYVEFEDINTNMINALVSAEDKRFWENPGVDIIGLVRAGIYGVIGKNTGFGGTSTLTQQLIRNTIIANRSSGESLEEKLSRKVKEIYLAYRLTSTLSKEKIIELYLNKIAFGHNAYGIEEAAKTFFAKNAKDLGILESAILASLPKGPTYYSPYNYPGRILGYPYFYSEETPEETTKILTDKDRVLSNQKVKVLTDFFDGLQAKKIADNRTLICNLGEDNFKTNGNYRVKIDSDGCSIIEYSDLLGFLNAIKIELPDGEFIEYQTGRKDFILGRMLEDKYINFDKYKASLINGIGLKFTRKKEKIKAAHFVFFVKEYLEQKYGKDIVSVGGLKIYTTLDPELQDKAEELIEKYSAINKIKFTAENASLISLDNKTGEILAMVGGRDYFDIENKGNVNMTTSAIQPGSTFKPFVYSLGLYNSQLGSKTPVFDLETKFPSGYTPSNFDGKFLGKMDISTALNNSRNIPAIKMFTMAGGESQIVGFMKKLGVESLKSHGRYGAPLALGTGEMSALELASAYSVFANSGIKRAIHPILRIEDSKGNIIEEFIPEEDLEPIIDPGQTYMMNKILSDTTTRPEFWNNYLSLKDRAVAAKTGTSTKQYIKWGKKDIFPRNLWTVGYTPQITTAVWAGNTDGTQLNYKGNGLEGAGPIWRDFMSFAHKGKRAENWKQPSNVKDINISSISGKLPNPEGLGNNYLESSLFLVKNIPDSYDNSYKEIQIDTLCDGLVSDITPESAIKKAYIFQINSLLPDNPRWEDPVKAWSRSPAFTKLYGTSGTFRTTIPEHTCERTGEIAKTTLKTTLENSESLTPGENTIEVGYQSNQPLKTLQIFVDGSISQEIEGNGKKSGTHALKVFIPASKKGKIVEIKIQALDTQFYATELIRNVAIGSADTKGPEITITNPSDQSITLYEGDFFNFRALLVERSSVTSVISIDDIVVSNKISGNSIKYPVNTNNTLSIGKHTLKITSTDSAGNISSKGIKIEVLPR